MILGVLWPVKPQSNAPYIEIDVMERGGKKREKIIISK